MNVLELPPPLGCTTSECDGLKCGSVDSTTSQDCNVTNHQIVEQIPVDCIAMQEAPEAHLSNKSSGPGHGCLLNRQHPDKNQSIANNCQYGEEIAQEARVEGIILQKTVKISFHEITKTLNVLVNDGSSIGSYTIDLIVPPKLTSEITQLSPLNQKMFLRDLRSGKVKQICLLVAEMSTSAISDRQCPLPRMKEFSVDHQWTRVSLIKRLGLSDIHLSDVSPEAVPVELPKYKRTRHEIDMTPGSKYCVMKK